MTSSIKNGIVSYLEHSVHVHCALAYALDRNKWKYSVLYFLKCGPVYDQLEGNNVTFKPLVAVLI